MKSSKIKQEDINKIYCYDSQGSVHYESEKGHGILGDEIFSWKEDLKDVLKTLNKDKNVLDVGCGTGVFSRFLYKESGCNILGIDSSIDMIEEAQKLLPKKFKSKVIFKYADAHNDISNFEKQQFDYITSRQVVCHFIDPLKVFENWNICLKVGGYVLIIEGLWKRKGNDKDKIIDQLPLACHQSLKTIPYFLEKSGFQIEEVRFLENVNKHFDIPRYMILARKI